MSLAGCGSSDSGSDNGDGGESKGGYKIGLTNSFNGNTYRQQMEAYAQQAAGSYTHLDVYKRQVLLILLFLYRKHKKYEGELFLLYLFGYGLGRVWIEGLRTDQLLLPGIGIPVSQLLAGLIVVGTGAALLYLRRNHKKLPFLKNEIRYEPVSYTHLDEEIFHLVQGGRDIVEAAQSLVKAAKENGGTDNIGIVLVEPFADEVSI